MIASLVPALRRFRGCIAPVPKRALRAPSEALCPATPAEPVAPIRLAPRPADAASAEESPAGFLGWFDSSHELRAGLQVIELGLLPEGLALPLA